MAHATECPTPLTASETLPIHTSLFTDSPTSPHSTTPSPGGPRGEPLSHSPGAAGQVRRTLTHQTALPKAPESQKGRDRPTCFSCWLATTPWPSNSSQNPASPPGRILLLFRPSWTQTATQKCASTTQLARLVAAAHTHVCLLVGSNWRSHQQQPWPAHHAARAA